MIEEKSQTPKIENIVDTESISDAIEIEIISPKIFKEQQAINAVSSLLIYRQDLNLTSESMDYAALVITSIEVKDDGSISIYPPALAAASMDHVSKFSRIHEWIQL
ncbi:MAG: hypothetical protein M0P20_03265 [Methanocorpusculum sp.]|jgi:hypothetical protein|nr:hypothetical protein [Methanocorpusculum sp.]MDD2470482.1 hypothetical protein [Methanocorpusculum sp.]MDD3257055.1 hypothetical protein [Methanocorpusculum sp.]